jgi:hypothetical protein
VASIRFLLDEHVAHAVAHGLRRRGIDALTPGEVGLLGATDEELLARAREEGCVIVTHDGDFLRLHATGVPHAGIAYSEQGARTIGQLIAGLVLMYEALPPEEIAGRVEFL